MYIHVPGLSAEVQREFRRGRMREGRRGPTGASQGLRTHALLCDVAREGFNPPGSARRIPPDDASSTPPPSADFDSS